MHNKEGRHGLLPLGISSVMESRVFQQGCICIKEKYQPTLRIASSPTRRIFKGTIEGTTCQTECKPPLLSAVLSSVLARFQWFPDEVGGSPLHPPLPSVHRKRAYMESLSFAPQKRFRTRCENLFDISR